MLAGFASIIDPSGFLLFGVLLILALHSAETAHRYLTFAAAPILIAVLLIFAVARPPVSLDLLAIALLLPLMLLAPFGWPRIRQEPYLAAIVAWGILEVLTRGAILHGLPGAVIVPGLIALAIAPKKRITNLALLIVSAATLIAVVSSLPITSNPSSLALRLPFEAFLQPTTPVSIPYSADLKLIGVAVNPRVDAGQQVNLRLDWQVGTPPTAPLTIQLDFLSHDGQSVASHKDEVATDFWQPGNVSTRHTLSFPLTIAPGALDVYVTVSYRAARLGQQKVARLIVPIGSRPVKLPVIAELAGGSKLLPPTFDNRSEALIVTLRWQSAGSLNADYKFFLHLEGAADALPAQVDDEPQHGAYPTSLWQPGDVIEDPVTLSVANVPPGDYTLTFGMYTAQAHLSMFDCHTQRIDSLRLAAVHIASDRSVTVQPLECDRQ